MLCAGLWLRTAVPIGLTKRCDDGQCRREKREGEGMFRFVDGKASRRTKK